MINLILPQTCTVSRSVADWSEGYPSYSWSDVATDVPCLYVKRDYETWHADALPTDARSSGVLYCDLDAPLQAQDTVKIAGIGNFNVEPEGGIQTNYLGEASHQEWPVRQLS